MLDTNVLVAALRSRTGSSNALLKRIAVESLCDVHISVPLYQQYAALLARHGQELVYTASELADILTGLSERMVFHNIYFLWRPLLVDPEYEMVAELAITAGVDVIVTHITRDFHGVEAFGIRAVTPVQFLMEIGASS